MASPTGTSDRSIECLRCACGDSIVQALGVWPLIVLGLLLVLPSVMAASAMRSGVPVVSAQDQRQWLDQRR